MIRRTVLSPDGRVPKSLDGQERRVTLLVDSRDRDYAKYPSASQYVVNLPQTLNNVKSAVLISAEMPSTYYVFSAAKGTTSLRVTVNVTTNTVTIPDGNYTTTTMAAALKTALETAFAGTTFTITFNPATYKCTISISPSNTLTVDCTTAVKNTDWGLGYYLGFARGVATTGTATITGSLASNMNPELYYLIDIAELNAVDETAVGGRRGAFAKVPLQSGISQNSFYSTVLACFMCNEQKPPKARLDKLSVSIRFRDGTLVDFNNAEHSMTVELVCTQTLPH